MKIGYILTQNWNYLSTVHINNTYEAGYLTNSPNFNFYTNIFHI